MPHCLHCGNAKKKIRRCSRCKYATYCSEECQKLNFESHHKKICCAIPSNVVKITNNIVLDRQYVIVDRIIIAVCQLDQQPNEPSVNWINIPASANSVANASFWLTYNFNKRKVCLGEFGPSVTTTQKSEIAENNKKKIDSIGKDLIIPPQFGYKVVNIQEIRLTKIGEKPAKQFGDVLIQDQDFTKYIGSTSPRNFIYWINRGDSLQSSILYARGPTILFLQ